MTYLKKILSGLFLFSWLGMICAVVPLVMVYASNLVFPELLTVEKIIFRLPDLRFVIIALLGLGLGGIILGILSGRIPLFPYDRISKEELVTYIFLVLFLSYFIWKSFGIFSNRGYIGLTFLISTFSLILPFLTEFLLQGTHASIEALNYCKTLSRTTLIASICTIVILLITTTGIGFMVLSRITYTTNLAALEKTRNARYPTIDEVQPALVYHATKVVLNGRSFDWDKNIPVKLMSTYGKIETDLWTDTKIIFSIPLHWKDGKVSIWIEKPIEWQTKKTKVKSNIVKLTVLSALGPWSKEDDEYFNQLRFLHKETLKLNGYE